MTTQEVIVVGETQRFECQVIGFPTPSITWYKDEVDITQNPRYNIEFHEELGIITLMIKNVNLADEGVYVCRAENTEGHASTTAYLVVRVDRRHANGKEFQAMTIERVSEEELSSVEVIKHGRSTVIEEVVTRIEETEKEVVEEKTIPPKITYDQRLKEKLGFKEGATVYLEVNYTGYPQPHVFWQHNEAEIQESASVTMETMDGWSYVKVKDTSCQDSGIYKVTAENAAGKDNAEFKVMVKSAPASPRNLRVVEVYKDYIVIAWDEPEHTGGDTLLGYQIEKTLSGDKFVNAGHADAGTTQYKVNKLFEGTDYVFRVSAENRIGMSSPTTLDKPVKARLPYDPPGRPLNLRVTDTNKDYICVAWDAPENNGGSDIIQYIIEKKDATRASGMWIVAGTVDADELKFRSTKLFQGNKYLYRVFAENRVGPGEAIELSEPATAKLPYDKPGSPRNIRAIETDRDFITIAWDAPETDGGAPITNYVVEKRDSKHPTFIYIADIDANTFQYKAMRLFEGYEYYFQVIAENVVGASEPGIIEKAVKAKLPFDEPDSPSNMRVKEYWTDFITVTWDSPASDGGSPITGYIIEKRDIARQNWVKAGTVTPDINTFKAINLFEGAEYMFRVFAENKVGPSKMAAELDKPCRAKMPFDPPFAPRNLRVTDYNTDYISIAWDAPEHDGGSSIKGYVVEKHDTHMPMWIQAAALEPEDFSYKSTNLFEGQSYEYRVAAVNECGRGQYIETERPTTAKLPYDKASKPRNLRVTDVWSDYMVLSWETPADDGGSPLSGYTIEQRDAYEAAFRFVATVGADVNSHQVTNLQEGHEYYYRVYSQNSAGLSEKPAEIKPPVKAKLPFEKPYCPRRLKVTDTGAGRISVAWEAPESDGGSPITQYHLEVCKSTGTTYTRVASLDGSKMAHDITDLVDGGDYYLRVYAENKAGLSKNAYDLDDIITARKPIYKPEAPRNLRVSEIDKTKISLEWDSPEKDGGSDITNYLIETRSDMDISWVPHAKLDGNLLKYTARDLLEGTDYNFRVKSRNAAGVSDGGVELSKPVTARLPFDPPAAPRNLRVTDVNKSEITVAWDMPEFDGGAKLTGYTVELRSLMDKKYKPLKTVAPGTTSYTALGLTDGTEYYFRIRAKNDAGIGEPLELTEPVTAKAPYDVPKEPQNLVTTSVDKASVTLAWEAPVSDGGSPLKGYVVEMRSAKETKYKVAGKVPADSLSYTASDLKEGAKYTFRVKSENIAGTSEAAAKLDKPVKAEAKQVKKEPTPDKKDKPKKKKVPTATLR